MCAHVCVCVSVRACVCECNVRACVCNVCACACVTNSVYIGTYRQSYVRFPQERQNLFMRQQLTLKDGNRLRM